MFYCIFAIHTPIGPIPFLSTLKNLKVCDRNLKVFSSLVPRLLVGGSLVHTVRALNLNVNLREICGYDVA